MISKENKKKREISYGPPMSVFVNYNILLLQFKGEVEGFKLNLRKKSPPKWQGFSLL